MHHGIVLLSMLSLSGCLELRAGLTALTTKGSHIARTPVRSDVPDLEVPDGFEVSLFADGLGKARMLATLPSGDLIVTRPREGDVLRLRDPDGDGQAAPPETLIDGLPMVHGLTVDGDRILISTDAKVLAMPLLDDGEVGPPQMIFEGLPNGGRHDQHNLGVGPDGALYISVGSSCNACVENHPFRATMIRIEDGSSEIFATGLRNTQGFDWHPSTGRLYGMDNGADHRGDDLPPEELNLIEAGSDYGWPYAYGAAQVDGQMNPPPSGTREAIAEASAPMVAGYTAHTAPIAFVFYDGSAFPEQYRGDAFVALHGSWNRKPPAGYEVVRVRFDEAGQHQGFEPFLTGFLTKDGNRWVNHGRPAGLAVAPDGSLFVSDDANGRIFRVRAAEGP